MYKLKRDVDLRVTGGTEIRPEGTPCGTMYNSKREVQCIYKAKRKVNLRRSGGTGIWREGTPCGMIYNAKLEV